MKRLRRATAAAALLAGVAGARAAAQEDNPSLRAQRAAHDIVSRAVEGAGGRIALERFRRAEVVFASRRASVGQGLRPDVVPELGPADRITAVYAGGRVAYHTYAGDNLAYQYLRGDDDGEWAYSARSKTVTVVDPLAVVSFLNDVVVSPLLLLELLDRPGALRYLGHHEDEVRLDVVTYADRLGQQRTLYFRAGGDGRLVRIETVSDHPQWGQITTSIALGDYRRVDGVSTAHEIITRLGRVTEGETTIADVTLGVEMPDRFEWPADATEVPATVAPTVSRDLTVETLGEGIYLIPDAAPDYHVVYVTLDGGTLVFEAPANTQTSMDVIRTIRDRHPDQPVRWVVPTHHHFDHSGGLYGFIRHGATVVTTEGNGEFVRQIGAARRIPDGHPTVTEEGRVETFSGRRTVGDGARRVELIDVGPNPHVDEMIVAYFPAIKTVFVADLYSFNGTVRPANANQLAFADRLEELDLDIETFIGGFGQRATAEQFWESVRLGRDAQR